MTLADTTAFFLTVVAIALAPGPVVLMLMVRAAGNDTRGAIGFGLGFAIGGVAIITVVLLGFGAMLQASPEIFAYGKWALLAYILYLARNIWRGGVDVTGEGKTAQSGVFPSVCAGATTCLISPYMMLLFPLMISGMLGTDTVASGTFLLLAAITFIALAVGSGLVIGFASQLRRVLRTPRSVERMNRGLALLLVSAGSYMALT